jgi:hypothetical protein
VVHGSGRRVRPHPSDSKNLRGKKNPAGLTRAELAQQLRIGLTTVDKLIALRGLRSVGARGKAKLYRAEDARHLLRKLGPAETTAAEILRADYQALAEDLRDRRRALVEMWIADTAWMPGWRTCIDSYKAHTARWPAELGAIISRLTPESAALLDGDPRFADLGEPIPFVRPRLEALADAIASDDEASPWVQLARALDVPEPEAPPAPAATVDEARTHWHEARAMFRRTRVDTRRGHRRRARVLAALDRVFPDVRLLWLTLDSQAGALAGRRADAVAAAERLRQTTIHVFERLLEATS